jgi:hexosaminidase
MRILGLLLFVLLLQNTSQAQIGSDQLSLVPWPNEVLLKKGQFVLNKNTAITFNVQALDKEATYLGLNLLSQYGVQVAKGKKGSKTAIELKLNTAFKGVDGAYSLQITKHKIVIESNTNAGIFYGMQSLIQLIPVGGSGQYSLPLVSVKDAPRYAWRGMHLDCSRHFFSTAFVKKYIEMLASYKMNVFHWHLTDDQGWRIEIKMYPKLTEVGAWRKGSMVGAYKDQKFDSIRYGGYYTQEEIREVVAYAEMHHVTVVPEIEMPGHALAALAAYPEYSCSKAPAEVGMRWGVETNVFCPTEETFDFLGNILREVMALFPSKYIHIGGDEVLKDEWNKSEVCKEIMARENLKDAHELQSYFIKRIEKIVNENGRMIIGWDEILEGGLAPNAAVMSWRGIEGGKAAARQKHPVVMSPGTHCYFDHYQGKPTEEPLAIGGFTPLDKVYSYEPTPDSLSVEEATYIMGAQANVWTEYINTSEQVEYMSMPRMTALAEVLWSKKESRNYEEFYKRMQMQIPLLESRKINFCRTTLHK